MKNYYTDGIILSQMDYGEKDRILKIITRDKGIISAIAKGIKSPTSKKAQHIDILAFGKLYLAKGKNLDILLNITPHDSLLKNIEVSKINYIFYFAELVLNSTIEESYDFSFFKMITALRENLESNLYHSMLKLQLEILKYLGSLPNLRECIMSEESLKEKRFFDPNYIGYNAKEGQSVSDTEIKTQLFLASAETDNFTNLKIEDETFKNIFYIQNNWLELALERKINSFKFLNDF